MARYRCGPTVLRPDASEQFVEPGAEFEASFSPEQEAALLACGAIERLPESDLTAAPSESEPVAQPTDVNTESAGTPGDTQKE